jgi:hypothetical protein
MGRILNRAIIDCDPIAAFFGESGSSAEGGAAASCFT